VVRGRLRRARICRQLQGIDLAPGDCDAMTIRNRARTALVLCGMVFGAACSGGSSSPTSATGSTVADVHGQYSGTYRITKCVDDGSFAGFCAGGDFRTDSLPIALTLAQNQGAVTGTITLGSVDGTFQGTVSGSTLTGAAAMTDAASVSTSVTDWNTTLSGNALSGTFILMFRLTTPTGSVKLTATIAQLTR
jgi:hypothetical protein